MRAHRIGSIATFVLALAALAPSAQAATGSILYNFLHPCCGFPEGHLDLINGNLFGTGQGDGYSGHHGQVFELTNSSGTWTSTSIHIFAGSDGSAPAAGIVQDSYGNLYGTTASGDTHGAGNVFYVYNSGGSWNFVKVWAFGATGDGANPTSDLQLDSSGNLYGTTQNGGANGDGIVFELSLGTE